MSPREPRGEAGSWGWRGSEQTSQQYCPGPVGSQVLGLRRGQDAVQEGGMGQAAGCPHHELQSLHTAKSHKS